MFNVKFADIGEGIHEGVVFELNVEVGAEIKEGQTLFLVETDKVTAEIPSPVAGKILKINAKEGDQINVGEIIVVIDDGSDIVSTNVETEEDHVAEPQTIKAEPVAEEESGASVVGEIEVSSDLIASSFEGFEEKVEKVTHKILATPVARKLAKDLGINIQNLKGSGPAGRIMKADIYKASKSKEIPSSKVKTDVINVTIDSNISGEIVRVPMTMIRKTIAEHMVKSKFTIPHTAVMDEVDVTNLVDYRNKAKDIVSEEGIKLTYMSFIIKAVIVALKKHEIINSSLDEENNEILLKKFINIGIAVDTPQGLMVPVINRADHKSILEIANEISDLATRAQNKQLHLDELKNSTFTVTNYGAFGASYGVPVINYPDAAVLGIGMIIKKPIVIEDEIVIRSMLPLSMSFDHRIIDGADAGRFMVTLKKLLSNPELLLLS